MKMRSICVYCGSSPGRSPDYLAAASELGTEIAKRGMCLVYGGASVGLMGEVARAALKEGGKVTGIIPRTLADQEVAFTELDDLFLVDTMHERKARMAEMSDGFIAMPGGYGTLDEFFEVLTWAQLGLHMKPCGLLNVNNFYDQLLAYLDHTVQEMFVYQPHRAMILSSDESVHLIDQMEALEMAPVKKTEWVRAMKDRHTS